jgi:hypothetical protein
MYSQFFGILKKIGPIRGCVVHDGFRNEGIGKSICCRVKPEGFKKRKVDRPQTSLRRQWSPVVSDSRYLGIHVSCEVFPILMQ